MKNIQAFTQSKKQNRNKKRKLMEILSISPVFIDQRPDAIPITKLFSSIFLSYYCILRAYFSLQCIVVRDTMFDFPDKYISYKMQMILLEERCYSIFWASVPYQK